MRRVPHDGYLLDHRGAGNVSAEKVGCSEGYLEVRTALLSVLNIQRREKFILGILQQGEAHQGKLSGETSAILGDGGESLHSTDTRSA
mmetsp:Transcript_61538/g.109710  ORF Transcript_61538/g.109710 Transcript_61538/m.109710 type:complete len:88 (+) Transcript_61538:48-311(+)